MYYTLAILLLIQLTRAGTQAFTFHCLYKPFANFCMGAAARAMLLQNRQYLMCFISIFDNSDSNSSLPCLDTFKPKTFLKHCVLHGFWQPLLETFCFTTFLFPSYCRTTGAMRGTGLLLLLVLDYV